MACPQLAVAYEESTKGEPSEASALLASMKLLKMLATSHRHAPAVAPCGCGGGNKAVLEAISRLERQLRTDVDDVRQRLIAVEAEASRRSLLTYSLPPCSPSSSSNFETNFQKQLPPLLPLCHTRDITKNS